MKAISELNMGGSILKQYLKRTQLDSVVQTIY